MRPDFIPKPFPIPVVALGHGAQPEDDGLDYLPMPAGMATYQAPCLPEPEELAGHGGAVRALHQALAGLQALLRGEAAPPVLLNGLSPADLKLLNQVLGEGEVSAQVLTDPDNPQGPATVRAQESVFAGVWRVLQQQDDGRWMDQIELGAVPAVLRVAAATDARLSRAELPLPAQAGNARAVLTELAEHRQHWQAGQPAAVVNLSLLPLAPDDIGLIDMALGTGRVLLLSRGYGNCRISNCLVPHTWRVVYYNSQDTVILNSVEVIDMPEVACAAPEDLADSAQRLAEVLAWVEQA